MFNYDEEYQEGFDNESEMSKELKYEEVIKELPSEIPISMYDFGSGMGLFEQYVNNNDSILIKYCYMYDIRYRTDTVLYEKALSNSRGLTRLVSWDPPVGVHFDVGVINSVFQDCKSEEHAISLVKDLLTLCKKVIVFFRYNSAIKSLLMVHPGALVTSLADDGYDIFIRRIKRKHLNDNYILVATGDKYDNHLC